MMGFENRYAYALEIDIDWGKFINCRHISISDSVCIPHPPPPFGQTEDKLRSVPWRNPATVLPNTDFARYLSEDRPHATTCHSNGISYHCCCHPALDMPEIAGGWHTTTILARTWGEANPAWTVALPFRDCIDSTATPHGHPRPQYDRPTLESTNNTTTCLVG